MAHLKINYLPYEFTCSKLPSFTCGKEHSPKLQLHELQEKPTSLWLGESLPLIVSHGCFLCISIMLDSVYTQYGSKTNDGYLIPDFGYVWLCVFIFNQVDKIETYFFRLRVRATQVNCQKNNTNQAPTRTSRRERQFSLISLGPVC
jgi:hypothetical protein